MSHINGVQLLEDEEFNRLPPNEQLKKVLSDVFRRRPFRSALSDKNEKQTALLEFW